MGYCLYSSCWSSSLVVDLRWLKGFLRLPVLFPGCLEARALLGLVHRFVGTRWLAISSLHLLFTCYTGQVWLHQTPPLSASCNSPPCLKCDFSSPVQQFRSEKLGMEASYPPHRCYPNRQGLCQEAAYRALIWLCFIAACSTAT